MGKREQATPELIRSILSLRESGMFFRDIGKRLGITEDRARSVHRRYSSSSSPPPPPPEPSEPVDPSLDDLSKANREKHERARQDKLFKELLSQKSMVDAMVEALWQIVPALPRIEIPRLPDPRDDQTARSQTALLLISDEHVGQEVRPTEVQGLGSYNYGVFKQRKRILIDTARSIIRHHQLQHPVDRLVIAWLGDNLEGDSIYASQRLHIDLDLMQQLFGGVEELTEIPLSFLDLVDTIENECVVGNHGRIGKKGDNKTYVSWDYVLYKTMELKTSELADRIKWSIPESFFAIREIEGWNWLFWHGDDVKSWGGIPWYGLQRAIGNWIQIFNQMERRFDYAALGHFHQEAKIDQVCSEFFVNGSWVGTNEYSVRLRSMARPKQSLMFVHPEYGVTARYPLLLDHPE